MGMQERTFAVSNVLIPASYAALMCLMPSSSPSTHDLPSLKVWEHTSEQAMNLRDCHNCTHRPAGLAEAHGADLSMRLSAFTRNERTESTTYDGDRDAKAGLSQLTVDDFARHVE